MNIKSLKTIGVVRLSYPQDLRAEVERTQKSWKKFCALPLATKKAFAYSNKSAGVGYEMKDGSGSMGDIKENFDVALVGERYLKAVANSGKLDKKSAKIAGEFVSHAIALIVSMTPLVIGFAKECEKSFGLKGFTSEIANSPEGFFVRFIHYPPQKSRGESTAQAHPDQSGFTLHLFESSSGLECLTYDGKWVPMPVSESETVIIPDMQMQLRSKGILRALWHRVTATSTTARRGRFSAVSFIQFKDTPKYNKDTHGRLQEKPEGFNYKMSHKEFAKFFK